jgi:hypothetical protein
MEQLTIRMPKEHLIKIKQIAKNMGLKKSDITRLAIKHFVDGYGSGDNESPFNRARDLIGVAESGISDLGQNHREYLIKKIKSTIR